MKKGLLVILFVSACVGSVWAAPDKFKSEEWFAMTESHQRQYISMAIGDLQYYNVPIQKNVKAYLEEINTLYTQNPDMEPTPISVILPSLVYKNEPESRKLLDGLIKKHLVEIDKTIAKI